MFRVAPGVIFQVLSAVCTALLAAKLFSAGLAVKYRIFFVYIIFRFLYSVTLLFLNVKSDAYFYFFVVTEPLIWLMYIGVVVELYGLVLKRHRGFYTLGRWAMFAVMLISVATSALALAPHITTEMPQASRVMGLVVAGERAIDLSLALFLLLMLAFLNLYTVPLSRNVVVHAVVYTVFFLSNTLGMILRTVFGLKYATELDTGLMALSWGCSLAWLFLLSPKGEETRLRSPWFGPEQEERILWQLDSMNATLMKAGRR
jgi:hypothetical protein